MATNRDNFSIETKRLLAARVAYRCCYPGCRVLTIGPSAVGNKLVTLGEASHIRAAAPGGPRFIKKMTNIERKSFDNGIWLCRHHARLIDADFGNYSAETLVQWKKTTEAETYRQMEDLTKMNFPDPTTIVCLSPKLMFEAVWKGAIDNTWRFLLKDFVYGDLNSLREYSSRNESHFHNYIIVESQGEGRLIHSHFEWKKEENGVEISVEVYPPVVRRDPNYIGNDLALSADIRDLEFENGDFKLVSGKELAKQIIEQNLNLQLGAWGEKSHLGSLFNVYYQEHKGNRPLLNRIIKIEITRLITIPMKPEDPTEQPELSFINRIHEVKVMDENENSVPVFLSLEWGDGSFWNDTIIVNVQDLEADQISMRMPIPSFITGSKNFEPIEKLRILTSKFENPEMEVKVSSELELNIFKELLPAIMNKANDALKMEIFPMFHKCKMYRTIDNFPYEFGTSVDMEKLLNIHGLVPKVGVTVKLDGFKKAGIKAFDVIGDLNIYFNDYNYMIGVTKPQPWVTKLYNKMPTDLEIESIANQFINFLIKRINQKILEIKI